MISDCTTCPEDDVYFTGFCSECVTGYLPYGRECWDCGQIIDDCEECEFNEDGNARCTVCSDYTTLQDEGRRCDPCETELSHCLECSVDGDGVPYCTDCQDGFIMTPWGECWDCGFMIPGCTSCYVDGGIWCNSCNEYYYYNSGDEDCYACSVVYGSGCITCDDTDCLEAEVGYFIDATGDSIACDDGTDGYGAECTSCTDTYCQYCSPGYVTDGTSCESCSSFASDCTSCMNEYSTNGAGLKMCLSCGLGYAVADDYSGCWDCS